MEREPGNLIDDALLRLLPEFLPRQRWFGGKSRPVAGVDVEDAIVLPVAHRRCALVIVGVRFVDGGRDRYSMVLAFAREHDGLPVVGRLNRDGEPMWAVEAASDPAAVLALLRGFSSSSPSELQMLRGGRLHYKDSDEASARVLADAGDRMTVEPMGAEQSNTSLRIDRTLAFKLFRKVDEGENPELEVGRFLGRHTTFREMPTLRGSLIYLPASGESATLGVLQDWIVSQGDGWTHVVRQLNDLDQSRHEILLRDLSLLGATTADFHAALATHTTNPAFAPATATRADAAAWHASLRKRQARVVELVMNSLNHWPEPTRRLGAMMIEACRHGGSQVPLPDPGTASASFVKIRIHGDYHLGQTLKTSNGFVLIDFEGEPATALSERRSKHAAMKDVAGMLRSFDYAVEAASQSSNAREPAALSRQMRTAFLRGYRDGVAGRAFVPPDPAMLNAWVDFFEIEKALYEVEYELNHRPAWVHIPLGGIVRILESKEHG